MLDFFAASSKGNRFETFSDTHLITVGIIFLFICALFFLRNQLKKDNWNKTFRWFLALTAFTMEISYHVWLVSVNKWSLADTLPLELCSLSLILCIILLITKNPKIFEVVYFTGIMGAGLALLTPELNYNFPHFRYVHFFYSHSVIVITCLFFAWVQKYSVNFRSVLKTMGYLNIAMVIILVVNKLVGGNYMFLAAKPSNPTPMDYLGPYPWYILSLEAVAFLLFILLALPFILKRKKQ